MRDGNQTTALELQLDILATAKKCLGGSSRETEWVLTHWESVLNDIPKGPEALLGRVDWASKYWMLSEFKKEENLAWQDPWLKSQDLEYHNLNRQSGLYWGLEESGDAFRKTSDAAIEHSKTTPPKGTRADGRGELIRTLMGTHASYLIDWIGFRLSKNEEPFLMLDPFISYKSEIRAYLKSMYLLPPAEE